MDITTLFKAYVKTVRTTNKNLNDQVEVKPTKILKFHKDVQLSKAKEVLKQISNLQQYLNENKAAYLNVINYLSTNKTMSENDREKIDTVAENIITSCKHLLSEYKTEIVQLKKSEQIQEHYHNVIESLEDYLKCVSKIYTEAKAVRIKRVIEAHKLSKLETKPSKNELEKPPKFSRLDGSGDFEKNIKKPIIPVTPPVDYNEELSAEDMQMFEAENEQLYNELNSISDEVRQMESKVVHIAELQELFTEKVLQQEKDIERIAATVIGSTENMRDANQQIKQAIQRNAGLRVWVLFFMLVMSFSLLFLDWYND